MERREEKRRWVSSMERPSKIWVLAILAKLRVHHFWRVGSSGAMEGKIFLRRAMESPLDLGQERRKRAREAWPLGCSRRSWRKAAASI